VFLPAGIFTFFDRFDILLVAMRVYFVHLCYFYFYVSGIARKPLFRLLTALVNRRIVALNLVGCRET